MNKLRTLTSISLMKYVLAVTILTGCASNQQQSQAQSDSATQVTLESQTKITDGALHFDGKKLNKKSFESPSTGPEYDYFFGKNISAHGDAVKPYKHYVFMTWYKGGKFERNVMLSRLNTKTGAVKTIEFPHRHTGFRGDPLVGESHNTIGLAISPINGTIHMVYDLHAYRDDTEKDRFKGRFINDYFRYSYTVPGAADVSDDDFTLAQFIKDTSEVSEGPDDYKHLTMTGDLKDKENFVALTYPKFYTAEDGTLIHYMRWGGNNNGAYYFNKYEADKQKWTRFTPFNHKDQKTHGHPYNWGLYGFMKYVNGKLRVGFQQRSANNNDRYKYQNGVYYAYSDHPDGMGEWKNHKGEPMTWPLVNSDEIKVFEPGDYIDHQEPNSVHIVAGFDWTVTANNDIHFISKVRSTNTKRPDAKHVAIHAYKPAGEEEFKISTDFTGGDSIYTAGEDIFIIGLKNGYPYVEKAKGGTNNFKPMYKQKGGIQFDHGTIHIKDGKAYYYLMEAGNGNALPLYLQILDLGINGKN